MGIDRIGKGGGMPPGPDAAGSAAVGKGDRADKADRTGAVDKPFHVERPSAATSTASAAGVEGAGGPSALARLRAGEIDVDRYLDLKVEDATKGLQGLPSADLAEIKKVLRDQLATDPGLVELVRTATGRIPSPPED